MKATVSLFLLLVISTLVAGRKLPQQNDPGSAMYDTDYPVDDEVDNDFPGIERFVDQQDFDFPLDEENDPGSGY